MRGNRLSDRGTAGILFIKAPRRRMIAVRGIFKVSTRIAKGKHRSYQTLSRMPYIEFNLDSSDIGMRKFPKAITSIVAELANGQIYVMHDPACKANISGKQVKVRFEVMACEEIG